jgi:hypothetical protein
VDLNATKIGHAQECRANARTEFHAGSFFDFQFQNASAVIFNDVLHHLPAERQLDALRHAWECLAPDGLILLKEVDPADGVDVWHTTFWDKKFYPQDSLAFCSPAEWKRRCDRLGFRKLGQHTVRHPWVASRSIQWFTKRPRLSGFVPPAERDRLPGEARVLVTGATGFIGEWVLRRLIGDGLDGERVGIEVVTRNSHNLPRDLRDHPGLAVREGDLADEAFTASLGGSYRAVFHLAAIVDYFGGESVADTNLRGTRNLVSQLEKCPPQRFVYTSTMGALDRSRSDPSTSPLSEDSAYHPTSAYGRAKRDEEQVIRDSRLAYTIVRIPWCYGPGMNVSHHVRNLLNRTISGSLATRVNWPGRVSIVDVREASAQLVRAATRPEAARETFFLAEEEPISFGQLFRRMGQVTGNTAAGGISLPGWCWNLARLAQPVLPFTLRCLVADALHVSTDHARALGFAPPPHGEDFLLPLARFNALEMHPCRLHSTVGITGAAGGIGRALARQFHAQGYQLVLADNQRTQLEDVCESLQATAWLVDLSDGGLAAGLVRTFPEHLPWPVIFINNAGIGKRTAAWEIRTEDFNRVVAVNGTAPAIVTNFLLQHSPHPVTVANIASTAALQPFPFLAAYSASKAFILNYSLSVAGELLNQGQAHAVVTVIPAGTQTGFQSTAGVKTIQGERLLAPEAVAAAIVAGVRARRPAVFVGARGPIMRAISSLIPLRWQPAVYQKLFCNLR